MKKKINKNKGILFFITGLSGSGKTTLSKNILKKISQNYGPTVIISSEKIRKIFKFNGYTKKDRAEVGKKNIYLINLILNQKVNVIYDAIALQEKLRFLKRKLITNYIEIYVQSYLKEIIKFNKKKKIYKKKKSNIVGVHIKPEFPKKPNVIIRNDFKTPINKIGEKLIKKIEKIII